MRSVILALLAAVTASAADRPNILWLTFEDSSPHLGCYGDKNADTPTMDALAARGLKYQTAWSNAPVCAPARTCIISGRWAPSDGSEHMRSEVPMPQGHKMYPQFLREAGWYCTNNRKEDYNLTKPEGVWDDSSNKAHWKNRAPGQPFFAVFNTELSHESKIRARPHTLIHDPAKVTVPPYHPDTPEVRHDWAQHFDNVTSVDQVFARQLKEVEDAGLAEDTIIFCYADHGTGMPRGKRWAYNSGLRVPFIVHFPAKWQHLAPKDYTPGGTSTRVISFIDLAPTLLSIAGIQPPSYFQGRAFAGKYAVEGSGYAFGFRGRMDERYDMMRSATDGRFVYIRHLYPHLPSAQHVNYMFQQATTVVWHQLFTEGKLNDVQSYVWQPKASEELYDLQSDPWETRNLAADSAHTAKLTELRGKLTDWMISNRDLGFIPESQRLKEAAGRSPKDHYASDTEYPVAEAVTAALQATDRSVADASDLLKSPVAAVRFWAAQGLTLRGKDAVQNQAAALSAQLEDGSMAARTAAAEALALHGSAEQQAAAIRTLLQNANPKNQSAIAAAEALNALDHLGLEALKPHVKELAALPTAGNEADPGRTREYAARIHEYLSPLLGYQPKKESKPAANPKRKKKAQ